VKLGGIVTNVSLKLFVTVYALTSTEPGTQFIPTYSKSSVTAVAAWKILHRAVFLVSPLTPSMVDPVQREIKSLPA